MTTKEGLFYRWADRIIIAMIDRAGYTVEEYASLLAPLKEKTDEA